MNADSQSFSWSLGREDIPSHIAGQIIAAYPRRLVTLNGGEKYGNHKKSLNSGLGIILICLDIGTIP